MLDQLTGLSFEKFLAVLLIGLPIGGGLLCAIISILVQGWIKIRQTELKQDMIHRGMSAQEIQTVLEAGSKKQKADKLDAMRQVLDAACDRSAKV
jgi:hypothetical protein